MMYKSRSGSTACIGGYSDSSERITIWRAKMGTRMTDKIKRSAGPSAMMGFAAQTANAIRYAHTHNECIYIYIYILVFV